MLFPGGTVVKNLPANAGNTGDRGFNPWVGKSPWRKKWQPIPVLLPGKSHGQRSLVDCSSWGHKRVEHSLATKQQQSSWKYIKSYRENGKFPKKLCARSLQPQAKLLGLLEDI